MLYSDFNANVDNITFEYWPQTFCLTKLSHSNLELMPVSHGGVEKLKKSSFDDNGYLSIMSNNNSWDSYGISLARLISALKEKLVIKGDSKKPCTTSIADCNNSEDENSLLHISLIASHGDFGFDVLHVKKIEKTLKVGKL